METGPRKIDAQTALVHAVRGVAVELLLPSGIEISYSGFPEDPRRSVRIARTQLSLEEQNSQGLPAVDADLILIEDAHFRPEGRPASSLVCYYLHSDGQAYGRTYLSPDQSPLPSINPVSGIELASLLGDLVSLRHTWIRR